MNLNIDFAEFQWLYPAWLLLLPLLALLLYWFYRSEGANDFWNNIIDPALQKFVLTQSSSSRKSLLFLFGLGGLLAILALAGPSFSKQKIPAYKVKQSMVVGLDLSQSMWAQDVKPNRLQHARFELMDFVRQRSEGQTGMVVFAGDAFVVSPLTDDPSIILSQVDKLGPEIIKAQGSRVDRAIAESVEVLKNAGSPKGHILLLTDGVARQDLAMTEAEKAKDQGYNVSIVMIGTEQGAPIVTPNGGALYGQQGKVIVPKLTKVGLERIADAGGGIAVMSEVGDADINKLLNFFRGSTTQSLEKGENREVSYAHNDGIWLLWLLVPLMLLMFRRGFLVVFMACFLSVQAPQADAFDWSSLWLNADQRGQKALQADKPEEAAKLFESKDWKGAAAYKAGQYDQALEHYSNNLGQADGLYNYANAEVKLGEYEKAVKSYEKVLKQQPDHADAKANLKAVKDWLEKQKQQQQNKQNQNQQQNQDQKQNKDNNDQQQSQQNQKNQQGQQQKGESSETSAEQRKKDQQQEKEQQKKLDEQEKKQGGKEGKDKQGKNKEEQDKKNQQGKPKDKDEAGKQAGKNENQQAKKPSDEETERKNYQKQLMQQIPDDPSGLWRRKFQYQYDNREQNIGGDPW